MPALPRVNPRPESRPLALVAWLLGLLAVALQAAALATRYFQPALDSDYLYPQRFVADFLGGTYPLSGWTISSSAYVFPDFLGSALLLLLTPGAPVLPLYVVGSYGALALVLGWALVRSGAGLWPGRIAGVALVNLLLAFQAEGDSARWLWWLGTATFHGGAVLLGFVQVALWLGPGEVRPGRVKLLAAGVLMVLGAVSDTLFLTQFVLPLGLALGLASGPGWHRSPRGRAFLVCLAASLCACAAMRVLAASLGWGSLPGVFRYAPTPGLIGSSAARMVSDLRGLIWTQAPGLIVLFLGGSLGGLILTLAGWPRHADTGPERRQASLFAVLSLLGTLLLPVVSGYWRNAQHGRYLLPCLVVPLWFLLVCLLPLEGSVFQGKGGRRTLLGALSAVFLFLGAFSFVCVRREAWSWPYPESVARLDRELGQSEPRHGLADYWHAHLLETLSRRQLHLNQLRADGQVQFWDNNAFHHFVPGNDGRLHSPRYDFIVVDGLDPEALRARYGEPRERRTLGEMTVWIYGGEDAARMSADVDRQVRAFVKGRPGEARLAP